MRLLGRRFAHQVFATIVSALVLFVVLLAMAWSLLPGAEEDERLLASAAHVAGRLLPPITAPDQAQQDALDSLVVHLPVALALHGADGTRIASTAELPAPMLEERTSRMLHGRGPGYLASLALPDGRWLVIQHAMAPGHRLVMSLSVLALLALAIGLGAYPLTRRVTRRLERLWQGTDTLGEGDLSARVNVEGNDEIAALATSFNHASEQIERLVETQQSVLVGASHELRSPLGRMRMALSLMADGARPDLASQVEADIAELDGLIDEILLTSRLQARPDLEALDEEVDLLALATEEAARVDADVEDRGPVVIRGSDRLLRRLLRNLLENARRHGEPPIRLRLESETNRLRIIVRDAGPGVPPEERERIFEPFYRPPGMAESGRGTGIGLALVDRIAQLHDGTARCEGDETGAWFVVELPLLTQQR